MNSLNINYINGSSKTKVYFRASRLVFNQWLSACRNSSLIFQIGFSRSNLCSGRQKTDYDCKSRQFNSAPNRIKCVCQIGAFYFLKSNYTAYKLNVRRCDTMNSSVIAPFCLLLRSLRFISLCLSLRKTTRPAISLIYCESEYS